MVFHPGSPSKAHQAYPGDVETLAENGLVRFSPYQHQGGSVEVTPLGISYYEWLKKNQGKPTAKVEEEARQYIGAEVFEHSYPRAYAR